MKVGKYAALGGVAFSALILGTEAYAQAPAGSPGAPVVRPERQENRSPAAIASENYEAKGLPLGSFRLFPNLELNEIYNDNIYATPYGVSGKTGSFVQLIKPSADLRSDWNNHMLNFYARGTFGIYSANSLENFQDFTVGTDGRLDIQRNWNVYGGASFNHLHEDRGSPNTSTNASVPPNVYNQITANLGYYQKLNRFSGRLDGRIDNFNYVTQGAGPTNGLIFNGDRDRTEFRESLRLGYEFSPGYEAWTRGGLNQRRYVNTFDSLGFQRDSSGWDLVGGLTIDFGGITSIEAFAGYVQQSYADFRFPQISAPTFGLIGYWNPIRELVVKPFVRRTIEDSSLTTAAAYLNTAGGVDVDYQMRPNIKLSGHGDYAFADYSQTSGNTNQMDRYLTLRAGATYNLTPNLYTGLSYQLTHKTSNLINNDYDQNLFMLRLGARL